MLVIFSTLLYLDLVSAAAVADDDNNLQFLRGTLWPIVSDSLAVFAVSKEAYFWRERSG